MATRILGPIGSRRRKRWLVFGPLALVLALALPAIVFGSALPPTGTSTHQFEFDGNLQVQGSTTGSCTSQPGDLDWSPSTVLSGAGTGNVNCGGTDAAVIKDVARTIPTGNNRSDCTATSANSSLYKPADPNVTPIAPLAPFVLGDGSAGQGVIVCDGTISKQTPSDTNGYVQGGHEDQGQNPVQWNISPASAPKKTDLSEVYTYGMIYKSPFDTVTPTVADNLLMIFDAGRLDTNGDFHVDFELNQKKINDCNDAATDGAKIVEVTGGGAAAAAGLPSGVVVTKVDDRVISSADALVAAVRSKAPGDKVTLTIGNGTKTAQVTLGGQPAPTN